MVAMTSANCDDDNGVETVVVSNLAVANDTMAVAVVI